MTARFIAHAFQNWPPVILVFAVFLCRERFVARTKHGPKVRLRLLIHMA